MSIACLARGAEAGTYWWPSTALGPAAPLDARCTQFHSVQLRRQKSHWTPSGPKKGVQFCTQQKLLNGQLLLTALTEQVTCGEPVGCLARSTAGLGTGPTPCRGKQEESKEQQLYFAGSH